MARQSAGLAVLIGNWCQARLDRCYLAFTGGVAFLCDVYLWYEPPIGTLFPSSIDWKIMAGRKPLDRQTLSVRALDVAEAIIAARGLNALNAREVAASVGCSVGSLYNIFGSLDRLIRFVNTRTLDRLYEAMKAAATKDKPVDQMVAICCAYIEFAIAQPLLWRAVFDHQMLEGKPRLEWYGDSIERMSTLAITVLSPLFKPDELWAAKHVATILWSGVHGRLTTFLTSPKKIL